MVKFMVANNKAVAYTKNLGQKYGKKRLLAAALAALLVIIFTVYIVVNKNTGSTADCTNLVSQSNNAINKAGSQFDVNNAYKKLKNEANQCASNGGVLGIGSSGASKLQQLQFYHDKATTGYMLGKVDEAKKDAQSGLDIASKISKSDQKKLKDYDQIVKDLQYLKAGTY
jgi:predicted small secreted protein